jgi:hypothetical protein
MEIFSIASIELDEKSVARELRFSDSALIRRLIDSVRDALDPRAAFRISYIDERAENTVVIDGVRFSSLVLSRNLEGVGRVFPFVLTLGAALDGTLDTPGDMLEKYLLDGIGNIALREARRRFEQHLRDTFALGKVSCMAPGSLEDWPIEEQKSLFSLLPGSESAVGVRLTESCLMIPRKSVSGIYFPSEVTFFSCQLCPRERCDARKARYDKDKAREYGVTK